MSSWLTPAPSRSSSDCGPTRRSNTWRSIAADIRTPRIPTTRCSRSQWYLQGHRGVGGQRHRRLGPRARLRTGVVVAVLDTGVLYDHPDLGRGDRGGKLLPGFDFVTRHRPWPMTATAATPTPPTRATGSMPPTRSNPALYRLRRLTAARWHGTRVAGMIGALTNNTAGVAGLYWNSFILPVRVLGKCGGIDSDILAGMRWAAGLHVDGRRRQPDPGAHPQPEPGRDRPLRAELPRRHPGADRAQGAGRDLGRQRRHGGVLAGELPGRRRDRRHSPCRQQGGFQQPRTRSHDRRAGRQLREHQWRALPVLAGYHLEQRHHGARTHTSTPTRSTAISAPVSRRRSFRASRR